MTTGLWDREMFVEKLRAIGAGAYHDKHPFHLAMNEGQLSPEALRGWVANRFYYQQNIPIKDAAILANCPVREVRRAWIHRILDHDGVSYRALEGGAPATPGEQGLAGARPSTEGGIEAWLRLGEACGISRDELLDNRQLLPGVRFAVDAYVNFARSQPWPIAVASSLTELFAPDLMTARLAAFESLSKSTAEMARAFVESASALNHAAAICDRPALWTQAKITVFMTAPRPMRADRPRARRRWGGRGPASETGRSRRRRRPAARR